MTRKEWRNYPVGTLFYTYIMGVKFYDLKIGGATVVCVGVDSVGYGDTIGEVENVERQGLLVDMAVAFKEHQEIYK